jgi:hypothetical protein
VVVEMSLGRHVRAIKREAGQRGGRQRVFGVWLEKQRVGQQLRSATVGAARRQARWAHHCKWETANDRGAVGGQQGGLER